MIFQYLLNVVQGKELNFEQKYSCIFPLKLEFETLQIKKSSFLNSIQIVPILLDRHVDLLSLYDAINNNNNFALHFAKKDADDDDNNDAEEEN